MGLFVYEKQEHSNQRTFCIVSDLNADHYLSITKSHTNPDGLVIEYNQRQTQDSAAATFSFGSEIKASPFYGIFGLYRIGNGKLHHVADMTVY